MIDTVPNNEISQLKKDYPNEFVVAGQLGTYYICFNVNDDELYGDIVTDEVKKPTSVKRLACSSTATMSPRRSDKPGKFPPTVMFPSA